MTRDITVSIVSHRQGPLVAALLRDLAAVGAPRVAAIILTRNVSEPEFEVPPSLADRTVVVGNPIPRGFGANHNEASRYCHTALFAILNPDLRFTADPFGPLAETFGGDHNANLGIVAPRVVSSTGEPEDAARRLITPWRIVRRRFLGKDRQPSARPEWLAGMFLLVRSEAFRGVDGFDERYFMYCEDFDLCARLTLGGWRLAVVPTVSVVHHAQRASRGSPRHLWWHVRSLTKMWASAAYWRYRARLRAKLVPGSAR